MKATININNKPVEIELTPDQVKDIRAKSFDHNDIDSLQAALDFNGKTLERFKWETERDTDQQKATKELEEIALAIRGGKELEMGARWYYPYFYKNVSDAGSVAGFSYSDYYCGNGFSYVGARLSVDTSDKAIYMGKTFLSIYARHLAPNKK